MTELAGARVVVTGGAGFIGSHLVEGLLQAGAQVTVLDDFSTGHRANLEPMLKDIELVEGDIRDLALCQRVILGARYVLHQAALGSVPQSIAEPATAIAVNVGGTANVFTAARDAGVRRVVYASSSSVYGESEALPKREGEEGALLSPYAVSKWMDEELAALFAKSYPLELVGLRYFNVYGPRQDPNGAYAAVVPRFFASCYGGAAPVIFGDGQQTRDFTYVKDVVRANLMALVSQEGSGAAYNVGTGTKTSVVELAETIIRVTGFTGSLEYQPARAGDIRHSVADTSRAEAALGWRATTSLAEGLAEAAASYHPGS